MKAAFLAFALLAATAANAATIAPRDAASHVGQAVTVAGVASVYTARSGVTFVDVGGSGRNSPFTGVIFKDIAASFSNIKS